MVKLTSVGVRIGLFIYSKGAKKKKESETSVRYGYQQIYFSREA